MKKIVFSDVDGTLLNSENKITPLTVKAIRKLQDQGIPFVIVSARSPSGIYPILEEYGFRCPIISYSGALILDENRKVLFHKGFKKPVARQVIEYIEKRGFDLAWCVYSLDQWVVRDKTDPRVIREETIVRASAEQGTLDSVVDSQINKILCICDPAVMPELERELKTAFPAYSIVKSWVDLLEIMESGITKATAIQTLCSLWGLSPADAVAFGDNYNDVEMLETVGQGFLMSNAPEELKERIPCHTEDCDRDGIYHALVRIGLI